jgi:hypothetical protein
VAEEGVGLSTQAVVVEVVVESIVPQRVLSLSLHTPSPLELVEQQTIQEKPTVPSQTEAPLLLPQTEEMGLRTLLQEAQEQEVQRLDVLRLRTLTEEPQGQETRLVT